MMQSMKFITILLCLFVGVFACRPSAVQSDDFPTSVGRKALGVGWLLTNDFLGDGEDRWRTGSYALSFWRGPSGAEVDQGYVPASFGQLLEYRLRGEAIAPANLVNPAVKDRPYVGVLSFGLHSHARNENFEASGGLDAVFVGEQTGISSFQNWFHELSGGEDVDLSAQLGDAVYPTASGEIAGRYLIGSGALRPFAELQVGVESFVRVGLDMYVGSATGSPMEMAPRARDLVTGFRYGASRSSLSEGIASQLVIGADVARVFSSEYLPEDEEYVVEPLRSRIRAGVEVQMPAADMFYGVTWLSSEFEAQGESQVVGSMNLNLNF